MNRIQLLGKVERAWRDLEASYAGLGEQLSSEVGVTHLWSVRDVIAHVTWWEAEALAHLPEVARGIRPAKYSDRFGGIDAFNAMMTEQKRALSFAEVLAERDATHAMLVDYLEGVPEALIATETPFRHRLRLDTYGHYPLHAKAIRAWRASKEPAPPVG